MNWFKKLFKKKQLTAEAIAFNMFVNFASKHLKEEFAVYQERLKRKTHLRIVK